MLKDVLKQTLAEELARVVNAGVTGGSELVLDGPWSMLAQDGAGWKTRARLDCEIYDKMRGRFTDDIIRETVFAAAGVKLSRTCLADEEIELLRDIAAQRGFHVLVSRERYIHRRDVGKGGAANTIERPAQPGEEGGLRNVYVASDASVAEAGRLLDQSGEDDVFGMLLGIPACCREAYIAFRVLPLKQNDPTVLVLDNTQHGMRCDPWLNYLAQYFGGALISFFPCSFACPAAVAVSKRSFEMLSNCDRGWARSFADRQRANILYTEYDGLHLFRRPCISGSIEYRPNDFISTEPTDLAFLIGHGNRLEIQGKHDVSIYCESTRLRQLRGEDVGMCVFD